jgi:class 3 adenylate cyclase
MTPKLNLPSGYFSGLDTIHIHVDGGVAQELVAAVVGWLDHEGYPTRLTSIEASIAGPQRQDLPPTYQSHTPGTDGQEQLEFFSTTLFPSHHKAKKELRRLLEELCDQNGIVIEAERVIGKFGQELRWSKTPLKDISVLHSADVGFQRSNTLPIEVHYSCDIRQEGDWIETAPLNLEQMLNCCAELDIRVGGWFMFRKAGAWAYRSNMFVEGNISPDRIRTQRDELATRISELGAQMGFSPCVTALVEQSLGVWKTPLKRWSPAVQQREDFKQVEELAKWEEGFENLERFWIVTANFLGDLRDDVFRAMLQNISKGVEYTYFLRSFADVQRLRRFAYRLSQELPFAYEYLKAVLLHDISAETSQSISKREYFIANPGLPNAEGYKLLRSEEVISGRLVKSDELSKLVAELETFTDTSKQTQGIRITIEPEGSEKPVARAVVYTDLKDSALFQDTLGDEAWETVLRDYDLIIATEVSTCGGEVVKNLGDGYLIIFDQAAHALRCAEGMQIAIRIRNARMRTDELRPKIPPHRIALDFGLVSRVTRAQGFDYAGKTLSRCARLIQHATENQVLMLDTFYQAVTSAFGYGWLKDKVVRLPAMEFKGLEGVHDIWQFSSS